MAAYNFLLLILQTLVLVSQTHQYCYHISDPQHGKIHVSHSYNYYQVQCDPGYILHGNPTVYCEQGNWDSPVPTCIASESMGCPELLAPDNGRIECKAGILSVGEACRFTCFDGYQLRGIEIRRCMANLQWSGIAPKCIPILTADGNRHNEETRRSHVDYSVSGKNENSETRIEIEFHPCKNLGGCQHICKAVEGRAQCRCRHGFYLASDGKKCIENSQSQSVGAHSGTGYEGKLAENIYNSCENHQCTQLCRIEKGRAQCRCNRGYILNKDDQRTCDKNTGPPIHPRNPCEKSNGGCEHKCMFTRQGNSMCACNPGYELQSDKKSCIVTCNRNKGGCQHFCNMHGETVVCSCASGYKLHEDGKGCIEIEIKPPASRATCYQNKGGCQHFCGIHEDAVVCSCASGYKLHEDGKRCIERAPTSAPRVTCSENNGGCEHSCKMNRYTVVCSCPTGYKLDADRKKCIDIDECLDERLNSCHHYCQNTEGSYTCSCLRGYVLVGNNKCEGCRKSSYWSTEQHGCVDCPANSFTNGEGKTSVSDCFCLPGFTGNPKENVPCLDIDECSSDNFGCSHTCVNTPGDAFCLCFIGYMVDKDNKTCIDIDECSVKNGGCDGHCHNTNGSFYCKCPEGFVSSNKDHYSCDDVDECAENNGGCQQLCVNFRGGYYCDCEDGYRLDNGLKNCIGVSCPSLPVPHHSNITCKKERQNLGELDKYPMGTVCLVRCALGFKIASQSNHMKCQKDGTWVGTLPECKSQRCPRLKVPENGKVHPSSCSTEGNTVKQKCTFTCNRGYRLNGKPVFTCKNNLTWNSNEYPVCEHEEIRAFVECTRDISVTLPPGKAALNVTIPEPVSNMDSYEIQPDWVSVGKPIEFKAGITEVEFLATSPGSNQTAKCVTVVHVIDKEPPEFLSCPDPIIIEGAKTHGEQVTWEEPEVTDNVKVELVKASVEPNSTFAPGSYSVEYVAMDAAGNTATCFFSIDLIRVRCGNLTDPDHGDANCMDWLYGKLCQPLCHDGYMRDPNETLFYSCGDSGLWEPNDKITECLLFTEAVSSKCPDGSELKTIEEIEEEICMECPANKAWSSTTRKCEEKLI